MAVRDSLSRFDVEIVEFKGGAYSHKPLLACDMLVVVPEIDEDNGDENLEWLSVGKGLFEQINAFKTKGGKFNKCDLLITNYYHEGTKEVGLGSLDCLEPSDEDDYVNYADMLFNYDECLGTLTQVLENRFGFQKSTSEFSRSSSRYRLLLVNSRK